MKKENLLKLCYFVSLAYAATQGRFFSLYLKSFGLHDSEVGDLLALSQVANVIAPATGAYLADRYLGRTLVFNGSMVITTILFGAYLTLAESTAFHSLEKWQQLILLGIIRLSSSIFSSFRGSLLDGEVLAHYAKSVEKIEGIDMDSEAAKVAEAHAKAKWGEIRVYGAIGWGVMNLIIGLLLQYTNGNMRVMVYSSYIVGGLNILIVYLAFEPFKRPVTEPQKQSKHEEPEFSQMLPTSSSEIKQQQKDIALRENSAWTAFIKAFCSSFEGLMFLAVIFVSDAVMILVEEMSFLYFVEDLRLSYLICGVTVVITVLFELPLFHYSRLMVEKYGHDNLIVVGLLTYAVRVLLYTLVPNGHEVWILGVEWLHGITIGTLYTARTLKIGELSPHGYEATFQGLGVSIAMLGSFLGEVLGGHSFEYFGKKLTYRVTCGAAVTSALLYLLASQRRTSTKVATQDIIEIEMGVYPKK